MMKGRKAMTLMLTDREMEVLDELASAKDMSKTAVLRQALRLYEAVDIRLSSGEKIFFEREGSKEKSELMVL